MRATEVDGRTVDGDVGFCVADRWVAFVAVVGFQLARPSSHLFPDSWNLGLRDPITEFPELGRATTARRISCGRRCSTRSSDAMQWALDEMLALLTWLPWFSCR